MAYETFEEKLADLISDCIDEDGRDAVISAMELQLMALKEEE